MDDLARRRATAAHHVWYRGSRMTASPSPGQVNDWAAALTEADEESAIVAVLGESALTSPALPVYRAAMRRARAAAAEVQ